MSVAVCVPQVGARTLYSLDTITDVCTGEVRLGQTRMVYDAKNTLQETTLVALTLPLEPWSLCDEHLAEVLAVVCFVDISMLNLAADIHAEMRQTRLRYGHHWLDQLEAHP